MSTKRSTTITLAIAALAFTVSAAITFKMQPAPRTSCAAWAEVFTSTDEMVDHSDVIVLAQAIQSSPSRIAYSDNGSNELPFEAVELKVLDGIKGIESGSTVLVERAGGLRSDGSVANIDIDGGAFKNGRTYLLFLTWQPDTGMLCQINDQGRYEVKGRDLIAVEDDEVTSEIHGKRIDQVIDLVRGYMVNTR